MSDLSRVEQLLRNALGEDIYEVTPQSRVEALLVELNELIEEIDSSVSPEDISTAVTAYLDEHLTNPTSPPVDTSLAIAGAAADAKKTGDEIGALKEGFNELPSLKTPEETEADLYVSDESGNVIAEFSDGHIKTKNFDSSDIDLGNTAKIATTKAQTDLDIADANGFVVVRIKDGAIITPNFNTANAVDPEEVSEIVAEEFPNKYLEKYRLNGIKWDALGDSLTDPATVGLSHKNYTRWIAEANGISLNNLGIGGRGYWQGIEDEVANIRSDTDIVTIFGSLNDITNYIANPGVPTDTWADGKTNYCARARRVFDAILAVRNDIRIGVILPTPWVNYNCYDTDTTTQENVENMLDALKGICKIYGIPVLDMYHGSNLRPWDSDFRTAYYVASDGYHPNELGNKLFVAPQIEAFLRSLAISY